MLYDGLIQELFGNEPEVLKWIGWLGIRCVVMLWASVFWCCALVAQTRDNNVGMQQTTRVAQVIRLNSDPGPCID